MKKTIKVDPETFSRIEKMISKNLNLRQIANTLKKEKGLSYTYTTLKQIMQDTFKKKWDKNTKKWIDYNPADLIPRNYIPGQIEIGGIVETPPIVKNSNEENQSKHRAPITPQNCIKEKPQDKKLGDTPIILQKMYKLQKDIDDIKKIVLELQRDNPKNRVLDLGDEFIKIYASEKSKSSVTVNAELKEKVKKFVEETYGIKDNDSLVINIALLLALYKGR